MLPPIIFHQEVNFFWRERLNLDVVICFYPDFNIIEVSGFDIDFERESQRLYFDKDMLFKCAYESDSNLCSTKANRTLHATEKKPLMNELSERSLRRMVIDYVLNRLTVHKEFYKMTEGNSNDIIEVRNDCERCKRCITCLKCSKVQKNIIAERLKAKLYAENLALSNSFSLVISIDVLPGESAASYIVAQPKDLEPVAVDRKRRLNSNEFENELKNFKDASATVSKASEMAGRQAGLNKSSIEGFQTLKKKNTLDSSIYSPAKIRWIKSIRRVILANSVKMYTKIWEKSVHNLERSILISTPSIKYDSSDLIDGLRKGDFGGEFVHHDRPFTIDSEYFAQCFEDFKEFCAPVGSRRDRSKSFMESVPENNLHTLPAINERVPSKCGSSMTKRMSRYSKRPSNDLTASSSICKLPSISRIDIMSDLNRYSRSQSMCPEEVP